MLYASLQCCWEHAVITAGVSCWLAAKLGVCVVLGPLTESYAQGERKGGGMRLTPVAFASHEDPP